MKSLVVPQFPYKNTVVNDMAGGRGSRKSIAKKSKLLNLFFTRSWTGLTHYTILLHTASFNFKNNISEELIAF